MSVLKDFRAWRKHEFHGNIEDMINEVERILEKAEKSSCEGCKYSGDVSFNGMKACTECCNNYYNKWMPKPKKTRQSEFLKMFPNAKFGEYDFGRALIIDPCDVNETLGELTDYRDGDNDCKRFIKYGDCGRCKDAYWNEEVENKE